MATPIQSREINEDKMHQFLGKVVGDFGASLSSSLAYLGQKLGLYKAIADAGSVTPAELAQQTQTNERYVREWLLNQASGGYVDYDPATGKYSLAPEQAVALTEESSPFYVGGGFFVVKAMTQAVERIEDHFRNGGGMLWGEHHPDLFIGTARFFRPGYAAHLTASWIPSLTGIAPSLGWTTFPLATSCGTIRFTVSTGTAKPMPEYEPVGLAIAVLTPMSRPALSSSGPPELPGLTAASV